MTALGADEGLGGIVSLADFESLARARIDPAAYDYVAGGAEDELTLADNIAAFRRRRLRPRVLVDVSQIDLAGQILGRAVTLPIGLAPVAAQGLVHPDAEIATARAAIAAGLPFCLSTVSTRSIEEVATAVPDGPGLRWFQLYVNADAGFTRSLVERAAANGYEAIVLTVDLPVLGYREREKRRGWALNTTLGNFTTGVPLSGGSGGGVDLDLLLDARVAGATWADLAAIRSWSSLPLVVKGILHPDDARLAVEHGAAAIVVSNHGGRQLDRAPASIDVLEEIVAAVDARAEVYVDGGVRRGTDVLIALSLGARAVFIGRPIIWALAAAGEAGVSRAIAIIREELERSMALLGVTRLADLRRDHVAG